LDLRIDLRRASVSIPSNIGEGKGRPTTGELIQFLSIASGSTLEGQTQLELALMLNLGDRGCIAKAQDIAIEELKTLNAAIATLRAKVAGKKSR
jgi:four helix bundle protein